MFYFEAHTVCFNSIVLCLLDERGLNRSCTESSGIPTRQEADHAITDPCLEITLNHSQQSDKMCMPPECLQTGMYVSTTNFTQSLKTSAM